jgi:DNA-binding LacI/PurR family transcriptional regulator
MVATDHEYGACIGTQHLIELGHWRIACVSGPLDWRCGLLRDPQSRPNVSSLNRSWCVERERRKKDFTTRTQSNVGSEILRKQKLVARALPDLLHIQCSNQFETALICIA